MNKEKNLIPLRVKGILEKKDIEYAKKRLDWLVAFTVVNNPFVNKVLMNIEKEISYKGETMFVKVENGRFYLNVNPHFLSWLTNEQANYVFFHECLHLVLGHCTRTKFDNHSLGNIACDLAVNQLIPQNNFYHKPTLIDGSSFGCFIEDFRKIKVNGKFIYSDIKDMQSAEYYYSYLLDKNEKNNKEMERIEGKKCIKGGKGSKNEKGRNKIKIEAFDSHEQWDSEDEIADTKIKQIVETIKNTDSWGSLSNQDIEIIMEAQRVRINWKKLVRKFSGNISWKDREATRKKPNRRTGFTNMGYKKIHTAKMLVAIDTSGSIDNELLSSFLSIVNKSLNHVPIDIMQFDCDIVEKPKPFNKKSKKFSFKGRGGTDFQPVIDICDKYKYKGVMILTDGVAPAPTKPKRCKVAWILKNKDKPPVEWGKIIYIEKGV